MALILLYTNWYDLIAITYSCMGYVYRYELITNLNSQQDNYATIEGKY